MGSQCSGLDNFWCDSVQTVQEEVSVNQCQILSKCNSEVSWCCSSVTKLPQFLSLHVLVIAVIAVIGMSHL